MDSDRIKVYQMIQNEGGGVVENWLREHALFCRVEPELLEQMLAAAAVISVNKGETAYDRTRFRRCLGILLEGKLRVQKEGLLISTLRQGEIFGAAALFNDEADYPTTLTALSKCRLLLIPQETVQWLIGASSGFAESYVTYLSGRIRFLSNRLDAVSAERGENKLARYLLSASQGGDSVTQSATQLCQRIGVGRATLYRAFEVLENDGSIVREGKTIRVADFEKLRVHCDGPM